MEVLNLTSQSPRQTGIVGATGYNMPPVPALIAGPFCTSLLFFNAWYVQGWYGLTDLELQVWAAMVIAPFCTVQVLAYYHRKLGFDEAQIAKDWGYVLKKE